MGSRGLFHMKGKRILLIAWITVFGISKTVAWYKKRLRPRVLARKVRPCLDREREDQEVILPLNFLTSVSQIGLDIFTRSPDGRGNPAIAVESCMAHERGSAAKIYKKGERGQPCHTPREIAKGPPRAPLINTCEYNVV